MSSFFFWMSPTLSFVVIQGLRKDYISTSNLIFKARHKYGWRIQIACVDLSLRPCPFLGLRLLNAVYIHSLSGTEAVQISFVLNWDNVNYL